MPILTEEERLGTLVAGRYRVESILGRGGTGVVFEATHTWTARRVAVKLLRAEYARDLGLVRRFLQEARTAAGIEHTHVVSVLDMGNEDDGTVYLVLELLQGESLTRLLQRERRIDAARALELLVPIMDALVVAHTQKIIHRDLKPDNIFLRRDARGHVTPKLLDFGMAKMVDAAWGHATQSGTLVGTPFYMSPEQAEGKPDQGPQSDVWSMGVIFYRCLTGELPFFADSPTALLLAIVQSDAPNVREVAPEVPESFAAVIDRALESDRAARWPSMASFLDALREAAERDGVAFPALPDPRDRPPREPFDPGPRASDPGRVPGRNRVVIGAALVVATLVAIGLTWALGREQDRPRERAAIASPPQTFVAPTPEEPAPPEVADDAVEPTPPDEEQPASAERPARVPSDAAGDEGARTPAREKRHTPRIPGVAHEW